MRQCGITLSFRFTARGCNRRLEKKSPYGNEKGISTKK